MGIEAILTSDLFGLRAALDLNTLAELDEKRDLSPKKKRTSDQESRLKELTKRLSNLGFTRSSPDPLYAQYVEKMTEAQAKEGLLLPTLTPDQQARQEKLAEEIIDEIRKGKDRPE